MLPLRHQRWRFLFQPLWLAIFAALALAGASAQVWAGLLVAALLSALLVKRAACSFACPLFPVGELLWRTGEKLFGRTFAPPFWLDLLLRSGKYLVAGWIVISMGTELNSVPMLFAVASWAQHAAPLLPLLPLLAALLVLSVCFQMPWCRYLCPIGAVLGLAALASCLKIRRDPHHCVRCHKCSHRCPASLPVMLITSVRSPECFACYRCVDGCPASGALAFATPGRKAVPSWVTGVVVSGMLLVGMLASWIM